MLFRAIRNITGDYSLYQKYLIFVNCKGFTNKHDKLKSIIKNGFTYGNQNFTLSERSSSMIRNGILSFIDETIAPEIDKIINMDLNIRSGVISKIMAYRGLMLSSCHCIENWYPKIIVVDDFTTIIPNQHVRYLTDDDHEYIDNVTGETKIWKGKKITDGYKDIVISPWDGCGICSFQISEEITQRLNICDEKPTSWMIRLPWCKGVIHTIDYTSFFRENNVQVIKDVWGKFHSIYDNMIIFTKSMFKGYKYFSSWEEYWNAFYKYNHCIGIAKWNYDLDNEPRYTRTSYQVLQTLNLDFDEFKEIAYDSMAWAEKIINGDKIYTYAFLGLFANSGSMKYRNDYMEALLRNPEMLNDPQIHNYLKNLLRKNIDEMKCGKVWVKGAFKILVSDLVMLMERMAGICAEGTLEKNEFWAKSYEGACKGYYVLNRNPHISASESVILRGTGYNKWYWHLSNVVMVNAKSITLARLNGADLDGDLVLLSNNELLMKGVSNNIPVIDSEDKITTHDREFTLDNIADSIILSMSNRIGEYSNIATAYLNRENKEKYLDFVDYISILNGKEIDKSKTGVQYQCPKYISKYSKPLPYFMKYAGEYYSRQKKFRNSMCNMNRLCWMIERWEKELKIRRNKFDFTILMDNTIPKNKEKFNKIHFLYLLFKENIKDIENIDYDFYKENSKLICPNDAERANYAVEICYKKYSRNSKLFAWVVAKDGILENIPKKQVYLPVEDQNSNIEYFGRYYSLVPFTLT